MLFTLLNLYSTVSLATVQHYSRCCLGSWLGRWAPTLQVFAHLKLSQLLMRQWLWILILLLLHKQKKTSSTLCSRLHSGHSLSFMCEKCGWSQEISSCARRTHRKCDCDCRMKIAASVTQRRTRASSRHVFTEHRHRNYSDAQHDGAHLRTVMERWQDGGVL